MLNIDDLRFAIRRLRKHAGVTAASVLALACGVGAAAAAWSLLSSVLLNPLPVDAPHRLFQVGAASVDRSGRPQTQAAYIYPSFELLRDSGAFDRVAAGGAWQLLVTERGAFPQQRTVYFANHDFFAALGVRLARGRTFAPDEDRRGAAPVAVIADRYWRRVFDADPGALGETVVVGTTRVTIVGIAPPGFRGLNLAEAPDLYLPLHTIGDVGNADVNYFAEPIGNPPVRSSPTAWIQVVGRLKPGDTADIATARLNAARSTDGRTPTFTLTDVATAAIPAAARPGMQQFTRLLTITVGLLLLIGCVTVGMLLLVRTEDRQDEFAVCLALGANRVRLARVVAAEGMLLSAAGALLAIPIAGWLFHGIRAFQLPGRIDVELLELSLDRTAWITSAAGAVLATTAMALVAGIVGFAADIRSALHARGGATRVTRRPLRSVLVASQVAVTLVLVVGAGLFARSLAAALTLNPGVDSGRILTGRVGLGPYGYTPERAQAFFGELGDRLRGHPAFESISLIQTGSGMGSGGRVTIDGIQREMPSFLAYTAVDDTYFDTMGLPITSGRGFSRDDTATSPLVVVVSESFGRLIAGAGSPLGHRITETSWRPPDPPAVAEVIGVVPDVVTNVNTAAPLVKYYSLAQQQMLPQRTIVARVAVAPEIATREILNSIRSLDPQVTPGPLLTLEEQIGRQMNQQRFAVYVLGTLGGIALLLTVLGTYVLAASLAAMRRREMSIRAALGATGTQLGGLVLRETAWLVAIGLAVGLALVWLGAGTIRALLYRVEPLDPLTIGAVCTLMLALALLVSLRPAFAAARVDFTRALRDE